MLRYIFMDCNPYVVDIDKIYDEVWKSFFDLKQNKTLSSIFNGIDKNEWYAFFENRKSLIEHLGQSVYDSVKSELILIFKKELKNYVKNYPLNENLNKFFLQAKENDAHIVIVSCNELMSEINKLYNMPNNVSIEIINEDHYLTATWLVNYASNFNLTYEEIACITQVKKTINDMIKNNIFCVTVNDDKDVLKENGIVLSSIDELDYSNISYNFFSNINEDNEEEI